MAAWCESKRRRHRLGTRRRRAAQREIEGGAWFCVICNERFPTEQGRNAHESHLHGSEARYPC